VNQTVFSQNGYQLVQCTVTFWDLTNVTTIWGEIDNYRRDKVNVTILNETFQTDLPQQGVMWQNDKQYQFSMHNMSQVIIGKPYTFSIVLKIDRIDPAKTVIYKPLCGINLITTIAQTNPPGVNQSITIPESELPPYVHHASASVNESVNWLYWSHYQRSALLLENSGFGQSVPNTLSGIGIVRNSNVWIIDYNNDAIVDARTTFGSIGDKPITGDWNGDRKTDIGVFRPSSRQFIFNTSPITRTTFGLSSDIPITGDWNGDSKTDIGVFRPSARQFIFNTTPITRVSFGLSTDVPITGDWNGDSITEVGVFRPSTRQFIFNTVPITRATFGLSTDIPITGDWNGDTVTDIGVFRPSTRQFIFNTAPVSRTTFGMSTDFPVTGKWV
jgi:hypothetical protein